MKRIAVLVPCMLALLAGASPVAFAAAPAEPAAPSTKGAGEDAVTAATLGRYLQYQKRMLEVMGDELKKHGPKSGKGQRVTAQTVAQSPELEQAAATAGAQIRSEVGLSEAEQLAARELVNDVMEERLAWRVSGGDKPLKALRRQIERARGAHRAELEQQLHALEENEARLREAKLARERHGDAAVTLVLQYDAEFAKLQSQGIKTGLLRFIQ